MAEGDRDGSSVVALLRRRMRGHVIRSWRTWTARRRRRWRVSCVLAHRLATTIARQVFRIWTAALIASRRVKIARSYRRRCLAKLSFLALLDYARIRRYRRRLTDAADCFYRIITTRRSFNQWIGAHQVLVQHHRRILSKGLYAWRKYHRRCQLIPKNTDNPLYRVAVSGWQSQIEFQCRQNSKRESFSCWLRMLRRRDRHDHSENGPLHSSDGVEIRHDNVSFEQDLFELSNLPENEGQGESIEFEGANKLDHDMTFTLTNGATTCDMTDKFGAYLQAEFDLPTGEIGTADVPLLEPEMLPISCGPGVRTIPEEGNSNRVLCNQLSVVEPTQEDVFFLPRFQHCRSPQFQPQIVLNGVSDEIQALRPRSQFDECIQKEKDMFIVWKSNQFRSVKMFAVTSAKHIQQITRNAWIRWKLACIESEHDMANNTLAAVHFERSVLCTHFAKIRQHASSQRAACDRIIGSHIQSRFLRGWVQAFYNRRSQLNACKENNRIRRVRNAFYRWEQRRQQHDRHMHFQFLADNFFSRIVIRRHFLYRWIQACQICHRHQLNLVHRSHLMQFCIDRWKSEHKMYCCHNEISRRFRLRSCWSVWANAYGRARNRPNNRRLKSWTLYKWHGVMLESIDRRHARQLFGRRILVRWISATENHRIRRTITERSHKNNLRKCWDRWCQCFRIAVYVYNDEVLSAQLWSRNLLRKCILRWQSSVRTFSKSRLQICESRRRAVLSMTLSRWQITLYLSKYRPVLSPSSSPSVSHRAAGKPFPGDSSAEDPCQNILDEIARMESTLSSFDNHRREYKLGIEKIRAGESSRDLLDIVSQYERNRPAYKRRIRVLVDRIVTLQHELQHKGRRRRDCEHVLNGRPV